MMIDLASGTTPTRTSGGVLKGRLGDQGSIPWSAGSNSLIGLS